MGSRCGDIDPTVVLNLLSGNDSKKVETILNKESGLKALAGTYFST